MLHQGKISGNVQRSPTPPPAIFPSRPATRRSTLLEGKIGADRPARTVKAGAVDTVEAEVRELVRRRGVDAVAGYGPLQRHLNDPSVEEVCINERLPGG